jgi:hypothetical protein
MPYQKLQYSRAKTITASDNFIAPPGVTNTSAVGTDSTWTLNGSGVITAISLSPSYKGSGYTQPPNITVTGGPGTGAIITANLAADGSIDSLTIVNGGSGYTGTTPTIAISNEIFSYAQPCSIYLGLASSNDASITVLTAGGDSVIFKGAASATTLPIQVVKVTNIYNYTSVLALW